MKVVVVGGAHPAAFAGGVFILYVPLKTWEKLTRVRLIEIKKTRNRSIFMNLL
jgi:hypothetical protein